MLAVDTAPRPATPSPIKIDLKALQQQYARPAVGPVPPYKRTVSGGLRSRRRSKDIDTLTEKTGALHLDTRPELKETTGLVREDDYTTVVVEEARSQSPEETLRGGEGWWRASLDGLASRWTRERREDTGGEAEAEGGLCSPIAALRRPTPLPTPPLSGGIDSAFDKRCAYDNLFPLDEDDVPVYRGDYGMALLGDLLREGIAPTAKTHAQRGRISTRPSTRASAIGPLALLVAPTITLPAPRTALPPAAPTHHTMRSSPPPIPTRPYTSYHAFIHTPSFRHFASIGCTPPPDPLVSAMLQLLPFDASADINPLLLQRKRWDGDLLRKRVLEYGMVRAGKIDRLRPWKSKEPAVRCGPRGVEAWVARTMEDLAVDAEDEMEVFAPHQYGEERGRSSMVKPCAAALDEWKLYR